MSTMKIGEEGENYAGADFSFPNNPRVVDSVLNANRKITPVPFGKMHIVNDFGGADPKSIVLTGEMVGTNKRTNYNSLAYHIHDQNIKKFFIESDRFYYVVGDNIKETLSGDKTNFIDYVANLVSPMPYAFSNTESTYTVALTNANETTLNDSTAGSTGAFTNDGNGPAFVKWEIDNTAGSNITQVEIGDASSLANSTRKITWTGTLSSGNTLTIYIFKFVSETGGAKYLKYAYTEIGSSQSGSRSITGGTTGIPFVSPNTTDQDFSIKLTGNDDTANITATYRSAYLG